MKPDPAIYRKVEERTGHLPERILFFDDVPENVSAAIDQVRPWAVDASSSLEREPGVKDHDRINAYVAAARR